MIEGFGDPFAGHQVERDASAVVRVARFEDNGKADLTSDPARLVSGLRDSALRHGDANLPQQLLRQFFVLSDVLANRTGLVRLGGPDAMLFRSLAKLHEASVRQSAARQAASRRRSQNRARARTQSHVVGQIDQLANLRRRIEGRVR